MIMRWPMLLLCCMMLSASLAGQDDGRWKVHRSKVGFVSDAPLERIAAELTTAQGVIDIGGRAFAVRIPVADMEGFNSPLQREHFNENYLRTDRFPFATFEGRIIESVDLRVPGTHRVRTKGRFNLHGVERERIIECDLVVVSDGIRVTSLFPVRLEDHEIRIPRVVQQKIAPEVQVTVDLLFRANDRR